jgi:hypothetical protein
MASKADQDAGNLYASIMEEVKVRAASMKAR